MKAIGFKTERHPGTVDDVERVVQMLHWLRAEERQGGPIGETFKTARLALIPVHQLLDHDKELTDAVHKGTLAAPSPALMPILVVPPPSSASIVPELHPEPASESAPKSVVPVQATVPVAVPILTAVSKLRSPMGLVDGLMAAIDVQQDSALARSTELNRELEVLHSQETQLSAEIAKLVVDLDLVRTDIDGKMHEVAENIAFRAICESILKHVNQAKAPAPGQGASFGVTPDASSQDVAMAALVAKVDAQFEAAARVAETRHNAMMSGLLRFTSAPPLRTQFGGPFSLDSHQPPDDRPGPGRG